LPFFNEACSSAADSANITVSSAYSNKYKRKYTATSSVSRRRAAVFIVLRKARKLNLPIEMELELFDTMVVPILLYGAEV
jgi:hypothetical protein